MQCPYCDNPDSKVTDSRAVDGSIRRRRECLKCGVRFTTYERVQTAAMLVLKRDGRREEFNRDKLVSGLRHACAKRPLPAGAIEKLVEDVEAELQKLGKAEVPSALIGELVMDKLKGLDRVAYVRFASVYRDFADLENFKVEIDALMQAREQARQNASQLPLIPDEAKEVLRRRGRIRRKPLLHLKLARQRQAAGGQS